MPAATAPEETSAAGLPDRHTAAICDVTRRIESRSRPDPPAVRLEEPIFTTTGPVAAGLLMAGECTLPGRCSGIASRREATVKRLTIVLVAVALLGAGCGDDDLIGGADQEAVAALSRTISEAQSDDPDSPIGEEEAACIAGGMVEEFGADRILETVEADRSFEDFIAGASAEERRSVVDLALGCVDLAATMVAEFTGSGVSESSARCLSERMLAGDAFRDIVAEGLATGNFEPSGDAGDTLLEELLPAFLECLSPEELANLG
jgi:hypothetical protein